MQRLESAPPGISIRSSLRRSPGTSLRAGFQVLNGLWQLRSAERLGRLVRVKGILHLENRGRLLVGDHAQLLSHHAPIMLAVFPGGVLEIGDRTILNYGVDIAATGLVRIGSDCLIATHAIILDNHFHELRDRRRRPPPRPVIIEDRVWLGNRVTVLPGVRIGAGTVVGAGSVVTHDLPAGCVAAGNPARVIRSL